jgi:hypothetical protein
MVLASTQPLIEIGTRNLPGVNSEHHLWAEFLDNVAAKNTEIR